MLFLDGEEAVNWDWAGTDNTYGSRHYVAAAQADGSLKSLGARAAGHDRRHGPGDPPRVDVHAVAGGRHVVAARRLGHRSVFSTELTTVEDDHVPFLRAGVPAVDIIDLDNPTWHTAQDDLAHVSRQSLQVVGDVVLAALPGHPDEARRPEAALAVVRTTTVRPSEFGRPVVQRDLS